MRLAGLAFVAFLVSASTGIRPTSATPCIVSGPQYQLTADTIDWAMSAGSTQICNLRFLDKPTINRSELISDPQFGRVSLKGADVSYTSKPDFHGADSFTIKVSGVINSKTGTSTIHVNVLVGGAVASRIHLPGHVSQASVIPSTEKAPSSVATGESPSSTRDPNVSNLWHTLKIGAGGFVTGIDIAPDGTKVVRTDTYGAYIWDIRSSTWKQLVTTYSMPKADASLDSAGGVYGIAIAPGQPARLYMLFNGYVYRSDDSGGRWSRTGFSRIIGISANDGTTKVMGHFVAVDPANPDIVYVGTPSNGLWTTKDGGVSWSQITIVGTGSSAGTQGGGHLISFDPSSSVSGRVTQGIYVSTYGSGVFHTNNGGATWSLTSGTPTTHNHMIVDQNGVVWLIDNTHGGAGNLNRYSSGHWSTVAGAGKNGHSIAINPTNPRNLYVGTTAGQLIFSVNGGTTWAGPTRTSRIATDIPWLAWTNENYMSNADMTFDPNESNLLYFAEGIGVWRCNPPNDTPDYVAQTWTSQNTGIENLASTMVLAPAGGADTKPVVLAWDRPIFYVSDPTVYPSMHGPNPENSIVMGWSADWAASTPSTIVAIMNWAGKDVSGFSSDGGRTWTGFSGKPATINQGGSIAALSATNFIWVESDNGNPYYTTDRGHTWTQIKIPGVPTSGNTGWGFAYYTNRQIVAADRVDVNTAYIYNYLTTPNVAGVYKTTDGGANWARVYSGSLAGGDAFNSKLKSVPTKAGHLFFSSGNQGPPHPANTALMRSTDGGSTWSKVGQFLEVTDVGFGAAFPGQSYPAIYVVGYKGSAANAYGIWRSVDNALTWTKIGDFPLGIFSGVQSIDGDKTNFGTVYVSLGGAGFAYQAPRGVE